MLKACTDSVKAVRLSMLLNLYRAMCYGIAKPLPVYVVRTALKSKVAAKNINEGSRNRHARHMHCKKLGPQAGQTQSDKRNTNEARAGRR